MAEMRIGAEGDSHTTVTMENVDQLKTRKVSEGGQVFLGKEYGGKTVTVAFRIEDENDETDDSDAKDS